VRFEGRDLLELSEGEMRRTRGARISMVLQDPLSSLNPVLTVGEQITETISAHEKLSSRAARRRAAELLELVRVPGGASRLDEYPHRFSGGMRQRILIAIAMACTPQLLLADEPTTALDVTIQAQILDLLAELGERFGMATVLITHDLGVVARMADEVVVMYAGRKVEQAPVDVFFAHPSHPYTVGLLGASPHRSDGMRGGELAEIRGIVPSLKDLPHGCTFAPRCPKRHDLCEQAPAIFPLGANHFVSCHLHGISVDA
jgi:peptide/nickel transport system ATP-binding protein